MSAFDDTWLAGYEAKMQALRVPARQLSTSPAGDRAGQHAQAAPRGVKAVADAGRMVDGDVCAPRRNKFGAIRTVAPASWGGTRIADSKAGAELARTLETLKTVGAIVDWAEEVSIPIGVGEDGKVIRYRPDAMILLGYVDAPDSPEPALVVRLVDRKRGDMDTPTSKAKRAALRNRGWNVEVRT